MPPAGHALRAEVGGGIIFVTPGEFPGQHKKTACQKCGWNSGFHDFKLYMLALVGRPSLRSYNACVDYWVQGASRRSCRQKQSETSFSPKKFFLFSRNSRMRFWGLVPWFLWIGRAKHPGPGPHCHLAIEVFNVGGWLSHGDLALDAGLDFLAVTEHRLIPARVRIEWARLKSKGVASIWAPASQDSSHVGNAGVGVVSLRCAPVSLPTFVATAQFKRFFDCGRAVRCMLPLGAGRFMHLVVLYGYHGADVDPEQLALTDHSFDTALRELSVVARGQPCMLVGDFNVEPTKIPCLAKGMSAGLWFDLEVSWASAIGRQPSSSCTREWGSGGGTRRDFMIGCPLAAAAVLTCIVQLDRWIAPHLAVGTLFDYDRWSCRVTKLVRFSPLWPASWLPAVDNSRGSKSVEVRRVWEIYDDRLQLMSRQDALLLGESLDAGDVSQARLVWSRPAETACGNQRCFNVVT